jgi:hypothetical protein
MVAYSHLRRRRGRTGHVPQIPSGVLCLGRDSYPRGAVVGAVINVYGVAAGVLSAPVDVSVLPDRPRFSAVRRLSVIYGPLCTVKFASLWSVSQNIQPQAARYPCMPFLSRPVGF